MVINIISYISEYFIYLIFGSLLFIDMEVDVLEILLLGMYALKYDT